MIQQLEQTAMAMLSDGIRHYQGGAPHPWIRALSGFDLRRLTWSAKYHHNLYGRITLNYHKEEETFSKAFREQLMARNRREAMGTFAAADQVLLISS